tara:strand:+ start:452 stop:559 length:108 start_codon:yes stop_codon:yes gene_type:complete
VEDLREVCFLFHLLLLLLLHLEIHHLLQIHQIFQL